MRLRWRDGKQGIMSGGMSSMGATEVQSAPLGTRCTRWKGLTAEQSDHAGVEVIRVRVSTKEFNDARKYGPHAELYFSFATEHESRGVFFLHSAGRRASLRLQ